MNDIIGKKFNRWEVVSVAYKKDGAWLYNCFCECSPNVLRIVRRTNLITGGSQSCGCLQIERTKECNCGRIKKRKIELSEYGKIAKMKGTRKAEQIAKDYKVSASTIFKIWQGK